MSKSFKVDLTGQRFGRLTVLEFVPNEQMHSFWLCKCDCGNKKLVRGIALTQGATQTCGCNRTEKPSSIPKLSDNRMYRLYKNIKQRCYNPNSQNYNVYGGKGITMCNEWRENFKVFYDWAMSHGYDDDLTIDRIDPDKGYFPENCQWISRSQNSQKEAEDRRRKTGKQKFDKNEYYRRNVKAYHIGVSKITEADIIDKLDSLENRAGYIKNLIRNDISKE